MADHTSDIAHTTSTRTWKHKASDYIACNEGKEPSVLYKTLMSAEELICLTVVKGTCQQKLSSSLCDGDFHQSALLNDFSILLYISALYCFPDSFIVFKIYQHLIFLSSVRCPPFHLLFKRTKNMMCITFHKNAQNFLRSGTNQ